MFGKFTSICYLIMGIVWFVITGFDLHLTNNFANALKIFIQSYAVGVLIGASITSLAKGKSK